MMAMDNGKAPAKLTVNFSYGDWPMSLEIPNVLSEKLPAMLGQIVKILDEAGAKPATPAQANAPAATATAAPGSPPVCKYHGEMKPSKKHGGWYCPSKMGDGSYCQEKVEA